MVNLREKPYYLNEEQIQWIEDTIAGMTDEEKIGQLFVNMVANEEERKPENLKKILDTYHPGAIRYHNASKEELWDMADCLQKTTKIPLLIASNCEAGGNGGTKGGTPIANGAALAAIDSEDAVYRMAEVSAREAAAVGCNWNFAPVVDLTYNWRNTIVQLRAFNDEPDDVIRYTKAFFKGMKTQNIATCMKHFPGDGTEENDQHLIMGVNEFDCEKWDQTFGKVYQELIDEGVMTIMAGHIALPAYSRKLRPGIKDEEIRPATLAPELITDLLKGQLGFNGMVVTDASHMIGMFGATIPRCQQVPQAIAAGCDMYLFFNDRDEDFGYMMEGYRNGTITEERLNDALHRILGVKAALNLHILQKEEKLMAPKENLKVVGCKEHLEVSRELADQYVTLVKDRLNYLPMTPNRYQRIKLVYIGSEATVIAGTKFESNDKVIIADIVSQLEAAGFEVDAEVASKKGKMEEFKKNYDCVLLVLNVQGFAQYNTMRIKWDEPTKQPWYMSELPTFVVSLSNTNNLIDVPMARCYINAYMDHHESFAAVLEKMMGNSEFKGRYNENVFCGRWETRF
ncbi:glycosyl hydrolase [Faecalicatena sp. AGMB00832]|uniref:Glycosyl hydrolase n=1 Tax=Faecalicatena faecalis TaxID=2726362 RepID=A0ABS6D7X7_9FIRM|nr:glycoside hydrolase family 3 N-terminal domain-containing protein [Faecalicatena faecalis]MBU3877695.1 glycosyl hydrolase [Faecalicatena faecalis]